MNADQSTVLGGVSEAKKAGNAALLSACPSLGPSLATRLQAWFIAVTVAAIMVGAIVAQVI